MRAMRLLRKLFHMGLFFSEYLAGYPPCPHYMFYDDNILF